MKRLFTVSLVLFLFTVSLTAESAYRFSSFGGGLPSSAVKTADASLQDSAGANAEKLSGSSTLSTEDKVWIAIGSVLVAAAVTGTIVWLATTTPARRAECWDDCADDCYDTCIDVSADECRSTVKELCSGNVDATCETCGSGVLPVIPKIPVYVP